MGCKCIMKENDNKRIFLKPCYCFPFYGLVLVLLVFFQTVTRARGDDALLSESRNLTQIVKWRMERATRRGVQKFWHKQWDNDKMTEPRLIKETDDCGLEKCIQVSTPNVETVLYEVSVNSYDWCDPRGYTLALCPYDIDAGNANLTLLDSKSHAALTYSPALHCYTIESCAVWDLLWRAKQTCRNSLVVSLSVPNSAVDGIHGRVVVVPYAFLGKPTGQLITDITTNARGVSWEEPENLNCGFSRCEKTFWIRKSNEPGDPPTCSTRSPKSSSFESSGLSFAGRYACSFDVRPLHFSPLGFIGACAVQQPGDS